MRFQFLGTGGYHPNSRRHTACIFFPELGVILDAGTGFFRVQERLQTRELDIYLTHAHLDHIAGLTFFIVPMLDGSIDRATVHAAEPYLQAVREHLFAPAIFPAKIPYEFQALTAKEPLPGGGVLTHVPLKHPGGSVGYKLAWPGRTLAYITDTTVEPSYLEFIRGVDVLIHECYFPDSQTEWCERTGHSHTTAVATLARDAGVGRLLLIHVDPQKPTDDPIGLATARSIFPHTDLAEDLLEIEF
jgi:ribonuclease BN (tRNA processing enzyme)